MSGDDELSEPEDFDKNESTYSDVVYQAQGAVSVDLGIDVAEAMTRMKTHARHHDQSIEELADLVMHGNVILDD